MSEQTGGYPASPGYPDTSSTTDVARDKAGEVRRTTSEAGRRVAGTAAEQAGQVGHEARRQARDLLGQARGQVTEQARNGQHQASEGLHSLARELHEMAEGGERQGPASDLAKQAADKLDELGQWLGRREPGDLVEEIRRLARRRPGAFLLGAAAAGMLAGRLTRGAVDANRETGGRHAATGWDDAQGAPIGSIPPVASPRATPMARTPEYPSDYPAGGPSATPADEFGSLPSDPARRSQHTFAPPTSGSHAYPDADPLLPFDSPPASPRPRPSSEADLPPDLEESGSSTPSLGTRTAAEFADDTNSPDERRPGGRR